MLRVASLSPTALSPQNSFNWVTLHVFFAMFFTFCCDDKIMGNMTKVIPSYM